MELVIYENQIAIMKALSEICSKEIKKLLDERIKETEYKKYFQ